ncbi:MAG TPA: glycosyltransferase family 4 protein [Candidatus Paceibacterota bacterium]|nr:glycosyltransferase family 4 protein [Candidatus Paceibacterota bacterium]
MRLLLFTQALDKNDPTLSAYHRLVREIAQNFDEVTAVCLKEGEHSLPLNVKVLSLGKEGGRSRLKYLFRFYKYILAERYDAVFVHMNQEYVLLGGWLWKLLGKRVYMWRNHHAGSWLTDLAAALCAKVFCTSRYSYTAKYRKTVIMPVGIDTEFFKRHPKADPLPGSILFLARMGPVKKPDVLVKALKALAVKGVEFEANFVGDALPGDQAYYDRVKREGEDVPGVSFHPGIPNDQCPYAFSSHEVFVNLSSSGMYDKTIFEAMACESMVLATNKNLEDLVDPWFIAREDDVEDIAAKLEALLKVSPEDRALFGRDLRQVTVKHHSLKALGQKLAREIAS